MGIIDDAIALEERAERNYRSAAERTDDQSAAAVLGLLADEEANHAAALRARATALSRRGPDLLAAARNWVRGAIEGGAGAISPDVGLLDVLRRAMDVERATETFYRTQAESAGEPQLAELFVQLADAEREHFRFVSSLVTYYNRPHEWIEDAEFGIRPEY